MSQPVHFIYEVLCSDVTACNTRAEQTPANTTPYDEYVTCRQCLKVLGYDMRSPHSPGAQERSGFDTPAAPPQQRSAA